MGASSATKKDGIDNASEPKEKQSFTFSKVKTTSNSDISDSTNPKRHGPVDSNGKISTSSTDKNIEVQFCISPAPSPPQWKAILLKLRHLNIMVNAWESPRVISTNQARGKPGSDLAFSGFIPTGIDVHRCHRSLPFRIRVSEEDPERNFGDFLLESSAGMFGRNDKVKWQQCATVTNCLQGAGPNTRDEEVTMNRRIRSAMANLLGGEEPQLRLILTGQYGDLTCTWAVFASPNMVCNGGHINRLHALLGGPDAVFSTKGTKASRRSLQDPERLLQWTWDLTVKDLDMHTHLIPPAPALRRVVPPSTPGPAPHPPLLTPPDPPPAITDPSNSMPRSARNFFATARPSTAKTFSAEQGGEDVGAVGISGGSMCLCSQVRVNRPRHHQLLTAPTPSPSTSSPPARPPTAATPLPHPDTVTANSPPTITATPPPVSDNSSRSWSEVVVGVQCGSSQTPAATLPPHHPLTLRTTGEGAHSCSTGQAASLV